MEWLRAAEDVEVELLPVDDKGRLRLDALRETVEQARRMPSALTKFALAAARR
jgi:cysteine sulfinate desulfinase/cysteine desulfurase-like protein